MRSSKSPALVPVLDVLPLFTYHAAPRTSPPSCAHDPVVRCQVVTVVLVTPSTVAVSYLM